LEIEGTPKEQDALRVAAERSDFAAPAPSAAEIQQAQIHAWKISHWRLRTMVEMSPYAIYVLDKEGRVELWNPMAEQIFGWTEKEALGRLPPMVPTYNTRLFWENHRALWAGEIVIDRLVPTTHKSGALMQMFVSKLPVRDDSGQVVSAITIMRDETERQRVWTELVEDRQRMERRVHERTAALEASNLALRQEIAKRMEIEKSMQQYQAQLKSLASDLRTTEERQRRRIASDLHDGIGQSLALAQAKLAELASCPKSATHREALNDVLSLIQQAVAMSRSLAYDLSPPILYDLGLEPALDWLAEKLSREYPMKVQFAQSGPAVPLNADMRATLFRAVWELLNNVYKHARTEEASIILTRTTTDLEIRVLDSGIGFALPQGIGTCGVAGLGTLSIRERMESLRGSMEIKSEPGKGTAVLLRVPLHG
jgi:PAS domain S-box-containing protein